MQGLQPIYIYIPRKNKENRRMHDVNMDIDLVNIGYCQWLL